MRERGLSLFQAVCLNMSMMVGIGPFITIPTLIGAMGGPQAMVGWFLGALVALADGMVWSELAGAYPGSGGTYHYFDQAFGTLRIGRLLKFLFVWQFLVSGPLEAATGAIGLARYLGYWLPGISQTAWRVADFGVPARGVVSWDQLAAALVMIGATVAAAGRIVWVGRLLVVFWVGVVVTLIWVAVTGLLHFDPRLAFDIPANAWRLDIQNARGLGLALAIALYDFLGYYHVCYLADEVEQPARAIPRSILISILVVGSFYVVMNLGILGVIPWEQVAASRHIVSDLMERVHGPQAAGLATALIIWTAFACLYAFLIGASRVPQAAARAGDFPAFFAESNSGRGYPARSLFCIGGLAAIACLASLGTIITALLATRIIVQFVGQIATLHRVHKLDPGRLRFRAPLYPIASLIALAGWLFALGTMELEIIVFGAAAIALGALVFLGWTRRDRGRFAAGPAPSSLAIEPISEYDE